MGLKKEGLKKSEAEKLLSQYGLNEIRDVSKNGPLKIFLHQVKSNFIVYLLVFATIISFLLLHHFA